MRCVPHWVCATFILDREKSVTDLVQYESTWQEGAGSLLLLAAAHSTGLVTMLTTAVSTSPPPGESRLTHLRLESLHSLLLTLLFLPVVGLRRTWVLRSYTGDALASLSGRLR